MTAGRLRLVTGRLLVAGWGLSVVFSTSGCALKREYVRRGQLLDTLAARVTRVEQSQAQQDEEQRRLRADILTELEAVVSRLDQLSAQGADLNDRLDRLSRKVGIGHGDITPRPESAAAPDSGRTRTDTLTVDADQLYSTAYLDFTRGKYEVATSGFRSFVARFSEGDNADNAQYWIGECFYSRGMYDSAQVEFEAVLTRFPDGNKAPAAAYKLALVFQQQGRAVEARRQFNRVTKDYPHSNEAKLARDRLQALGQ